MSRQNTMSLLPLDLKQEIDHLLHKHYFSVVLDELLVMTLRINESFDIWNNYSHENFKIYCDITRAVNLTEHYSLFLPRWQIGDRTTIPRNSSMYKLKKELQGKQHLIMIYSYDNFWLCCT